MGDNAESAYRQLKEEYPIVHEYSIGGFNFLFRPLTIRELSKASDGSLSSVELEDFYLEAATLNPESFDWDKMKAGHVSQYIDYILQCSGFDDLNTVNKMLHKHRKVSESNILASIKAYIITAMPAYKESDLLDISMNDLIRLAVLAEEIITLQQQISGIETTGFKLVITSAEEVDEPAEAPKKKVTKQKTEPQPSMTPEERENLKKAYIRRIRANNEAIKDVTSDMKNFDTSWLEDLDEDSLRAIAGVTKSNDPIAEQLQQGFRKISR